MVPIGAPRRANGGSGGVSLVGYVSPSSVVLAPERDSRSIWGARRHGDWAHGRSTLWCRRTASTAMCLPRVEGNVELNMSHLTA